MHLMEWRPCLITLRENPQSFFEPLPLVATACACPPAGVSLSAARLPRDASVTPEWPATYPLAPPNTISAEMPARSKAPHRFGASLIFLPTTNAPAADRTQRTRRVCTLPAEGAVGIRSHLCLLFLIAAPQHSSDYVFSCFLCCARPGGWAGRAHRSASGATWRGPPCEDQRRLAIGRRLPLFTFPVSFCPNTATPEPPAASGSL